MSPAAQRQAMFTHEQLDRRSLDLHRLVAEKLRRDPALFVTAQETLARWRQVVGPETQPYLSEWARLFDSGMDAVIQAALEDSEHGAALRQCSPLSCLLSNRERFAFLSAWRERVAT
jgi:hypothetical protein